MTEVAETQAPVAKKAKTEYTPITMQDGRVVEFAGKRKLNKESTITSDEAGKPVVKIQLDFRNGETRLFTIPDALLTRFAAHGAEQKLGDATAGLDDVDDQVLAVDELIDQLYNGEWSARREGAGMAGTSVLARALMELTGKDAAAIKEFLKAKSQAEKVALRSNPKVKVICERLEAEKASGKPSVDTEAMLGSLMS